MNTKKIVAIIAGAHVILVLVLFGILKATGFALISLFGASPAPSRFQSLVFDLFGLLLYPMCLVELPKSLPENWFIIGLWAFVFNSVIWGVCFGVGINAVRQWFWRISRHLSK